MLTQRGLAYLRNVHKQNAESSSNMGKEKKYHPIMIYLTKEQINILDKWAKEKTCSRSVAIRELVNKETKTKEANDERI